MEVIYLQDEAFYSLIEKVVARIKEQHTIKEDKWINGIEAMQMLQVNCKIILQKLTDVWGMRF